MADLRKRGKAEPRITIHSPASGVVLEKNVVAGTRPWPETSSTGSATWSHLGPGGLFESDAPYLQAGQPATMSLPWASGVTWKGVVQFVYPTVDEKTRAVRARLAFPNAELSFKPGMFVDVNVQVPLGNRLAVPDNALLASGEHRYAFVKRGEGRLQATEVKVGAMAGDYHEVLAGLSEGEEVATQATFLLSSEAQLRSALRGGCAMIARIIALCAKNRLATLLLVGLATAWGVLSLRNTALDAVPDLSDVQVIVFSEWMGRAPDLVEDNITYPVVSSMLGSPRVTAVRGQSMFGMSFVNVIFEDGTDMYWARSRVLEKLSTISNKLPQGVTPILGPDATGVGWVFEYALIDKTGHTTLQQLQSLQDWNIRYALQPYPA